MPVEMATARVPVGAVDDKVKMDRCGLWRVLLLQSEDCSAGCVAKAL